MEFEDEHEEEEHDQEGEEEDDDDEEITIPPPAPAPTTSLPPPNYNRVNPDRLRSGVTRYRECLKNHAVNIGGHAVDGCGEFMAAGEEGTLDALKCAACNCHRNFHRKEIDTTSSDTTTTTTTTPPPQPQPPPHHHQQLPSSASGGALYPQFSAYYRTPAPPPSGYLHHHHRPLAALPSTSSGEMDDPTSSGGGGGGGMVGMGRKRFRTIFTQEQKEKMLEFAEKVGWRIQKHDEAAVQQFCAEIQVKRQVLKVWMHNNKHTLGKKP